MELFLDFDSELNCCHIPSNGTKTLKLRLTVGPDGSLTPSHKSSPKVKDNKEKCKDISKVKDLTKLQKVNNLTQANLQTALKQCNSDIQGHCYHIRKDCWKTITLQATFAYKDIKT
jgi:hypothetical protein